MTDPPPSHANRSRSDPVPFDAERLRLKSALWDGTTGLASFHLHLAELRGFLDDRRTLALLHVTCGELGLVESLYGWQVLDRVMRRVVELVSSQLGGLLSSRARLALNGIAGEEVLIFEPGEPGGRASGEGIGAEEAARLASAVARVLDEGFAGEAFSSMTPRLTFRVGYALVADNPHFRFERIVYRAVEQARTRQARREQKRRSEWVTELRRIIRDADLLTLYQPVVSLETFDVLGYEAFSSGPPPGSFAAPGLMFAISERLGVSGELDRVCRRAALSGAASLGGGTKLFLNTRPESLSDPDWGRIDVSPEKVVIEVPEAPLTDADALREPVAVLRKLGFSIALDDVGTGYSSLRAIEAARPDYLKIDVSLVRDVDRSLLKQEVVGSILQIASRAGARVIAEGIETDAELETLLASGVRLGQGYLIARPSPTMAPGPLRCGGGE